MKRLLLTMALLALIAVPAMAIEEVTINHTDHGSSVPLKAQINESHLVAGFGYDMPNLIGLENDVPILSFLFNDSYLGFEAQKDFIKDPFHPDTRSYFEDDIGARALVKVTNYTCIWNCDK